MDIDLEQRSPQTVGELTFIGTATVLLRLGAFTFITDPNFLHAGEHAYLGNGLRSKRLTEPAMQVEDLPPLDFVLLSHYHGDHFDHRAAAELPKDTTIITEAHSAKKLCKHGFSEVTALKRWESTSLSKENQSLKVTAMPGKHSPSLLSPFIPPVMGSMVEYTQGGISYRIYITGDTLLFDDLSQIPERYPDIDLCLIHLGGTRIAGVLLTMDDKQGVRALQLIKPKAAVPIHYDDYGVFKSPLSDFKSAASKLNGVDVHYVDRGESLSLTKAV